MSDGKSFFVKVPSGSEQTDIFGFLVNNQSDLEIFDEANKQHLYMITTFTDSDFSFKAKTAPLSPATRGPLVITFLSRNDRYVVEAKDFKIRYEDLIVKRATLKVYRVQRRNHFRVTIPGSNPVQAMVTLQGFEQTPMLLRVADLSVGGMLVVIPKDLQSIPWKQGLELKATLQLGDGNQVPAVAQIRYSKASKTGELQVGVQFLSLPPGGEQELFSFVMRIYRQLFARLD